MTHMNKYELADKLTILSEASMKKDVDTALASDIFDSETWGRLGKSAQEYALMLELVKYMFYMDEKLDNILRILETPKEE